MRLLLDAHFDPEVARALRARGHDVISALEIGPEVYEAGDMDILQHAARARRAVVTRNIRDFVLLHRMWIGREQSHWGIVLVHARTVAEGDRGREIRALEAFLKAYPGEDDVEDQVVWLASP